MADLASGARRLRAAVLGCGHLGTYHARILAAHAGAELACVVDTDPDKAAKLGRELGRPYLTNLSDLPRDLDLAVVAVPTALHTQVAAPLLERGIACLVEKPIASTVLEAEAMLDAARRGRAVLAIGHVERFQPGLRKVLALKLEPRFIECHRLAPFSFRSTDIGVVHDLMIHDLDLILHLVPSEVTSFDAAGGEILTDHEDLASVRLTFANGARANLTASRVSLQPMRRFRMFSSESYVSLDFHKNYGLLVKKGPRFEEGRAQLRDLDPKLVAARPDLVQNDMIEVQEIELASEQRPLQAELDSFLESVRARTSPEVSGEDGLRALALAEKIVTAIRAERW